MNQTADTASGIIASNLREIVRSLRDKQKGEAPW